MIVVGLAGAIGAGKDVFAARLCDRHGFVRIGFADRLKQEVEHRLRTTVAMITVADEEAGRLPALPEDLVWTPTRGEVWWNRRIHYAIWKERSPIIRALLQEYGTEVRRQDEPHYWVRAWRELVGWTGAERVVVPDTRFPDEAEALRALGGVLIKIRRPGHAEVGHDSETSLADWTDWDLVVENDADVAALETAADRWTATLDARVAR